MSILQPLMSWLNDNRTTIIIVCAIVIVLGVILLFKGHPILGLLMALIAGLIIYFTMGLGGGNGLGLGNGNGEGNNSSSSEGKYTSSSDENDDNENSSKDNVTSENKKVVLIMNGNNVKIEDSNTEYKNLDILVNEIKKWFNAGTKIELKDYYADKESWESLIEKLDENGIQYKIINN